MGKIFRNILKVFYLLTLFNLFVSGDGQEEREKTPITGKFWVYEQAIRVPYYAIYEVRKAQVEVYILVENHYQIITANQRNHYEINSLGVELGIWEGYYQNLELPWLRWWDTRGNLLLTGEERAKKAEIKIKKMEALLTRYREKFGDLTE